MRENYFTFLFVRDPMERVLSVYKDKIVKDNKYETKIPHGGEMVKK